jgi:hypothetical protein
MLKVAGTMPAVDNISECRKLNAGLGMRRIFQGIRLNLSFKLPVGRIRCDLRAQSA